MKNIFERKSKLRKDIKAFTVFINRELALEISNKISQLRKGKASPAFILATGFSILLGNDVKKKTRLNELLINNLDEIISVATTRNFPVQFVGETGIMFREALYNISLSAELSGKVRNNGQLAQALYMASAIIIEEENVKAVISSTLELPVTSLSGDLCGPE